MKVSSYEKIFSTFSANKYFLLFFSHFDQVSASFSRESMNQFNKNDCVILIESTAAMRVRPPPFPGFFGHTAIVILALIQNNTKCDSPPNPFDLFGSLCMVLALVLKILDQYELSVLDRLGIFGPEMNWGKDFYRELKQSPIKFWYITGETIESFEDIVQRMTQPMINYQRQNTSRARIQRLTIKNRILLTLIWLRKYPRLHTLAAMFTIDIRYASITIKYMVPLMFEEFSQEVRWPTQIEWRSWEGHWEKFPSCVGIIDGTTHSIWRPSRNQRLFYRNDKKKHFMASHVIVTPDGMIAHCSAA
jgi:hypothetical protein